MTNEEKAKETYPYYEDMMDIEIVQTNAKRLGFIAGCEWKDDRIQHVIACATANLMATLRHCGLFTEESIVKCAEDFKNDLIKEANQ